MLLFVDVFGRVCPQCAFCLHTDNKNMGKYVSFMVSIKVFVIYDEKGKNYTADLTLHPIPSKCSWTFYYSAHRPSVREGSPLRTIIQT
jgi:hypothetical protein